MEGAVEGRGASGGPPSPPHPALSELLECVAALGLSLAAPQWPCPVGMAPTVPLLLVVSLRVTRSPYPGSSTFHLGQFLRVGCGVRKRPLPFRRRGMWMWGPLDPPHFSM